MDLAQRADGAARDISSACFCAVPSLAGRKCVASFAVLAASITALRFQHAVREGLCTMTFMPFLRAAIEIGACVWSGVITFTAVTSFSFSSSSRKST